MPPFLWFTANWIWVLTIAATAGLLLYLMAYRRRNKRK
jgi:hypothetical protein